MRQLFFCLALAVGMLGLWGWDAGVVAAQKPPVAMDTETAVKLELLQRRLDQLERKEREYLGLREQDQKETEKRLREFESVVKQDVEKETQKAKAWVENREKIVEWGLDNIAAFGTIISILFAVVAAYSFNTSRTAKKEMEMTRKLRKESQEHCERTDDNARKSENLYKKLENRLNNVTEALFAQMQNDWAGAVALWEKSLQTDPEYTKALFGLAVAHQKLSDTSSSYKDKKNHLESACICYNSLLEKYKDNHAILYNHGNALHNLAAPELTPDSDERRKLLHLAFKKFEQTCRIMPDKHEAFHNLGITCVNLAAPELTPDSEERRKLLLKACGKFEQACLIKPDKHEVLYNWGGALGNLAASVLTPDTAERRKFLREACGKYKEACRIKPDDHKALNNWGGALDDLSATDLTPEPEERRKRLRSACEKYEQALRIKPDKHDALYNWGVALAKQAVPDLSPDATERRKLLLTACEKYEQACRIKPDDHDALSNWGVSLIIISSPKLTEDEDERVRLLTLAESKFLEARRLNPKIAGYNLACVASRTNKPEECQKWLRESLNDDDFPGCDHIRTDADLDPVRNEQWFKDFMTEVCPEE